MLQEAARAADVLNLRVPLEWSEADVDEEHVQEELEGAAREYT